MKYIRFARTRNSSDIIPGIVDANENVRDISALISDIIPAEILDNPIFSQLDINQFPIVGKVDEVKIFSCVPTPSKLIAIAFNSKMHAKQMQQVSYDEPVFFFKSVSAICGARDSLIYPKIGKKMDWEGELGVIMGKRGKYITKEHALDYVFGYCCSHDVSDRHWQFDHPGNQHTKGKSFDTFAPLGPYIVTKDEISDPNNLQIILKVNNEVRQNFSTNDYKFSVQDVICFLSQLFPLEAGDVITMGSGPGTAEMWNGIYLQVGDQVELEVEKLGKQIQSIVKEI